MYLYEDRIRAVELYIKLGNRVGPTIRQLGYPTKNTLKGWYLEYQQHLDLPAGHAKNAGSHFYTREESHDKSTFCHNNHYFLSHPCNGAVN